VPKELFELLDSANIPKSNAVVVVPGTPLQEAIMVQSGEKLKLLIPALCPSSVFRRLPVDRLKIITVLSPLPPRRGAGGSQFHPSRTLPAPNQCLQSVL
jgi:hypothetical protein